MDGSINFALTKMYLLYQEKLRTRIQFIELKCRESTFKTTGLGRTLAKDMSQLFKRRHPLRKDNF